MSDFQILYRTPHVDRTGIIAQEKMFTSSSLEKSAWATASRIAGVALDLLLPLRCVACEREGRFLCQECEPDLPALKRPYCSICAAPGYPGLCGWCESSRPGMDRVIAPYVMDGPVREMVHRLKYHNLKAAAPYMARLMAARLEARSETPDIIMPTPLHPRRERSRGYNQAGLLAKELSRITGLKLDSRALIRSADTAPQVELKDGQERRQNVQGAFECRADMAGRSILLVDDVVTTGGTASACASALKAGGAGAVTVLALARSG